MYSCIMVQAGFNKALRYSSIVNAMYINVVAGHLFSSNEIRYMILIG